MIQSVDVADDQAAVCMGYVMIRGQHATEFTVVQGQRPREGDEEDGVGAEIMVGLARRGIDVAATNAYARDGFWAIDCTRGRMYSHINTDLMHGHSEEWEGMDEEGFGRGDVVGLLLDCKAGTLAVKKNGARPLTGRGRSIHRVDQLLFLTFYRDHDGLI
jgi:hypothetical protein